MKIKDIGGEFALIKRVSRTIKDRNVLTQIGDDTAVIKIGNKIILATTDTLVEDDHFKIEWFSPYQIGKKAMEINVSDIAAMGGIPKYALISLCLKKDSEVEFVDELYKGIYDVAKKYRFSIIGGNMTHGRQIVIDVAMLGETKKPILRSGAKIGDVICVTGDLGKSKAGLELFRKYGEEAKKCKEVKPYLEPKARLDESKIISKFANSMIDVSDGLASEVRHICELSRVGAVIFANKIPIATSTKKIADLLGMNPLDFALYGGEDFELVFTVSEKKLKILERYLNNFSIIGKILPKKYGIFLVNNGKRINFGSGYDHFK
ncbi:MAG: thiamine-phosphate kinase [Candidatus Aenigmatarchaeota archaeon]